MDTCNPTARKPAAHLREDRLAACAFSLVEVTMALGIFAFALTAIFGLLPLGLTTFRQAIDASVGSQICQRVLNDVQQTDFNVLTNNVVVPNNQAPPAAVAQSIRYFDEQGNEVTTPATGKFLYEVNTVISPATTMPNSTTYSNLAAVTIQIVKNPANKRINTDSNNPSQWKDAGFQIFNYGGFVSRNQSMPSS